MRIPFKAMLVVLFLFVGCTTPEEEMVNAALGTVAIVNPDQSTGSGVVIAPGIILTAYHVIVGENNKIYPSVDCGGKVGRVIFADEQTMLALIQVDNEDVPPILIATRDPNPYEVCIIIGYPEHVPFPYMSQGRIQSLSKDHWIYYSAPTDHGSSGGGIFIHQGSQWFLVGIVQQVFEGFPDLGRGTPRDVIEQFLERYHALR